MQSSKRSPKFLDLNYLKKQLNTLMLIKDVSLKVITIGLKKRKQSLPCKVCQGVKQ